MKRILIVDDSPADRSSLAALLGSWNIETTAVESGEKALNMLQSDANISLVLVDWTMPEMCGAEFLLRLHELGRLASVKIVMVTSYVETNFIAAALQAGVTEYIMKPFTAEMIRNKLASLGVPQLLPPITYH